MAYEDMNDKDMINYGKGLIRYDEGLMGAECDTSIR